MRSLLFAFFFVLTFSTAALAAEVHLSVAASMTDATKALIAAYQKSAPEVTFLPNFGASGSLAKQIAQGAPADLFISANPKWMDYLVKTGSVAADQVYTFAFNSLVLVGRKGLQVATMADLAKLGRIAIGSPKSVPAGQYAEQALKKAGLYERLAPKLVLAKDVRQALVYADRGEVDGAFVYKTDALLAQQAVILLQVPARLYDRVEYPVALTGAGVANPAAAAFATFLKSPAATRILEKFGFLVQ